MTWTRTPRAEHEVVITLPATVQEWNDAMRYVNSTSAIVSWRVTHEGGDYHDTLTVVVLEA